MIEIQLLEGLDKDDIYDLLLSEGKPFHIFVPKETQLFYSSNNDIASDYAYLAYAGQRLAEISNSFNYEQIPPSAHESVEFILNVDNMDQLAEVLLEISYGYGNDPEKEDFSYFEIVAEFMDKVDDAEITPACPYFVKIHKEYVSK